MPNASDKSIGPSLAFHPAQAGISRKLLPPVIFMHVEVPFFLLKVALQILGRKFYKNTKKSSLYSQSLLLVIHKTSVVGKKRNQRFTTA